MFPAPSNEALSSIAGHENEKSGVRPDAGLRLRRMHRSAYLQQGVLFSISSTPVSEAG